MSIKIYKVGGYVRDKILGIKSNDIDYVVVGGTISDMLDRGFLPVGRDFPVFLHPKTHAQYALARVEKKSGVGYHGFQFYTNPDVTLEQDLQRRDITINAIAEDEYGNLIDPFNGTYDILHKTIRHVSDAFIEDPLRVLRVARFKARFGFKIAPGTLNLMQKIVDSGELQYIAKERIWGEVGKALATDHPLLFFSTLYRVGALVQFLPELVQVVRDKNIYLQIRHKFNHHNLNLINVNQRFAIICGCLCLHGHNNIAEMINNKSMLGNDCTELSRLVIKFNQAILNLQNLTAKEILDLLDKLDLRRKTKRFNAFNQVLQLMFNQMDKKAIMQNIQQIITINNQFKNIDYANISQGLDHNQFLSKLKATKLDIIEKITLNDKCFRIKLCHQSPT